MDPASVIGLLAGVVVIATGAVQVAKWLRNRSPKGPVRQWSVSEPPPPEVAIETSDAEFWLLRETQRRGLRRQTVKLRQGPSLDAIWLGDFPVDYYESRWLYDLVGGLLNRGLLTFSSNVYRMSEDAREALRIEGMRRVSAPAVLINAETGEKGVSRT